MAFDRRFGRLSSFHPHDAMTDLSESVPLSLRPSGRSLEVPSGAPLQDVLFAEGVEFPCGGRGKCRGCRVRIVEGQAAVSADDEAVLGAEERADGWRLGCRLRPVSPLTIELAQWEAPVLGDDRVFEFSPREGFGVAVDLGTTTLVAQLVDLASARVLGVRTGLNAQARHGADLMSRLDYAVNGAGATKLGRLVREQLGEMIHGLIDVASVDRRRVREVVVAGNTVMHHLFAGLEPDGLSRHPFEPRDPGPQTLLPVALEWERTLPDAGTRVVVLPCLGSFVGGDILAGILATRLHESERPTALIDLGTNGEIVVGNRERMVCASTAAGPAFEGARISMGMRAATGAIASVEAADGTLRCRVIGGGAARGLCGSGLVDAVAGGLELGRVSRSGRLERGEPLRLVPPVEVSQCDVRELQLAKGAIAAGLRLLATRWGTTLETIEAVHLAGAFGNYINLGSARRIGLLPFPAERIRPAGNAALLGAKLALFRPLADVGAEFAAIRSRVEHIALNDEPAFMDTYVAEMGFP